MAYRFIKLQVPISDLMWNNKVDRIIWILGSVKTTNEKMFLLPVFYNMDNGQGLPQMIASISCEKGRHLVHNQTRFIRARFAMSPLGSWWKERMPRSTKYIFCDEASQIDQKLDGRVEISGWLLSSQYSIVKMSSYLTACVSERWRWTLFRSIYRTFKGTVTGHPAGVLTMKQ